ncbi:MAG TPA: c-type cytochrome [Burkholderiaceae bacterium]|jgi:cytochrome c5|nr:c-type cytochrome [Burkholderiaceae bacterium]
MSDAHRPDDHTPHAGPHEGPIKTPKQLVMAVVFAFIVPIIAIVLLVTFVASEDKPSAGSDAMKEQAVAKRIAPVGHVEIKDASDLSTMKTGEQVFNAQCVACHGTGAAGAPKFGDTAAWAPRIKAGYDALLNSALKGKGNMSAQGGGDFSDLEIGRAVVFMANKGGANFSEPKAAAAPQAASAPDAATAQAAQSAAAALAAAPAAAKTEAAGAAVPALYTQTCATCHAAGVAGAPKLGDKAAWASRVGQGVDALTASAIKGKGAMPPKGGSSASDAEIKQVVAYMVSQAK